MTFVTWLKMYLWPFPIPGSIKLSDDGRKIHQRKMDAWLNGKEYSGPRESIYEQSDEKARAHNRKLAIPLLPKYVKRWVVLTMTWYLLAYMAEKNDALVPEVIFIIMLFVSASITMMFIWMLLDLKHLERGKTGNKL